MVPSGSITGDRVNCESSGSCSSDVIHHCSPPRSLRGSQRVPTTADVRRATARSLSAARPQRWPALTTGPPHRLINPVCDAAQRHKHSALFHWVYWRFLPGGQHEYVLLPPEVTLSNCNELIVKTQVKLLDRHSNLVIYKKYSTIFGSLLSPSLRLNHQRSLPPGGGRWELHKIKNLNRCHPVTSRSIASN